MNKKFLSLFTLAIVLLGLVFTVTGCGRKEGAGITLRIWNAIEPESAWEPLLTSYQEETGVKIEYTFRKEWKENPWRYEADLLNALATGRGPDIVSIRNDWLPKHYDKAIPAPEGVFARQDRQFKNLSNLDYLSRYFVPTVVLENVIDNQVYALPFYVDSLMLYCNRQIFEKASEELQIRERANPTMSTAQLEQARKILQNYPRSWQELLKAIELIKIVDNKKISRPAIALGTAKNVSFAPDILISLMMQNGTQVVAYDLKKATFHLENFETASVAYPGRDALSFYSRFADPNDPYYTWNSEQPNSEAMFLAGNLAMVIADSTLWEKIQQTNLKNQVDRVGFPQIDPERPRVVARYWTNIVTTNSQYPETAWDFLAFASQPEVLRGYLRITSKPTPLKVAEEEIDVEDIPTLQSQIALGWYHGRNPREAEKIIGEMIDKAVKNRQNLAKLVDFSANKFTEMLQEQTPPPNSLFSQPISQQ